MGVSRSRMIWTSIGLLLFAGLPLRGQTPTLPTPEAAIQQAEQIAPAELPQQITALEIDAATRDQLRFDPAWQPILRAVQQDLMQLKWGNSQLSNPVWQQYGAKAYPLLDYYTRSADSTRQAYGMLGIRHLGQPYTTLWLERQLQRRRRDDFALVTASDSQLLAPESAANQFSPDWQQIFGLNDPTTRDRLLQLARQNLEPETSPTYHDQFNLSFLIAVLGYDAVFPPIPESPPPAIPEWQQFASLSSPSPEQVQQIVTYYRAQPVEVQQWILVQELGQIKAGELSAAGRAFLQALAADAAAPDRLWAIAELDRHGDPQAAMLLQAILNGNLEDLYSLTRLVSYVDGFSPGVDAATHAYYLLLGIAETYPQSRFVRAAREYGNLRGSSYWGGEPRSQAVQDQIAQQSPAQRTTSWQSWLDRYPDHPGADDATYFIARGWQEQNQIFAAFDLWVQLMTQQVGDSDATYLAWPHLRSLLDVGLTLPQIERLPQLYRSTAIAPLFRYALAVHYARHHDYANALATSDGLDLTQIPETVLGRYYNPRLFGGRPNPRQQPALVQQAMQQMLTEQRQRWQRLQQWQRENTPEAIYQIAADWAGAGGWKNGYLAIWDGNRAYHLPTGDWGDPALCRAFWVCDTALRGEEAVRTSYQLASSNAIALALFQRLLDDPATPAPLREKALYESAATLLRQWEDYPLGETRQIHPPAGILSTVTLAASATEPEPLLKPDYLATLDARIAALQQEFPASSFIDDLLFSRYAMSGERQYLQQIVTQYPQGDRAAEAEFLLRTLPAVSTDQHSLPTNAHAQPTH